MQSRSRNAFVLALVAGLVVLSVVVILTKPTLLGLDLKGGVQLTYVARPTTQAKLTSESLDRTIEIMRKRVDQLGVSQTGIQRTGADEIVVSLPQVKTAGRAEEQVGKTAQLFFYDWEPNVIGAEGAPAPSDAAVTGGANPGTSVTGLPLYRAVQRALKRPPIYPPTNSDTVSYLRGCTPELNEATTGPKAGCVYGTWYLLDTKHEKVLRGPETTKHDLFTDLKNVPPGAELKAVRVNPGTIVVQALPETDREGKVTHASPEAWYVLNDNPALTGADITNPVAGTQENGVGGPSVHFGFTGHGKSTFERVTRDISRRGENAIIPGRPKQEAFQHFAILLENQLITVPSIDFTKYPEGIDATTGSEITGNFTVSSAQNLANELQSGALPVHLQLVSSSQVSATLGKEALRQGVTAGLAGLLVVSLFLIVFYRVLGVVAVAGLAIYGIYLFALIKLIPVTLTLPGIAGVILTIGVAADANIVIFERIKEEIRGGRSVAAGIVSGYKHGFAAIIDANVVTFMTAFILFALATAEVQGFAFMLGLGVLVSLFTAVLATQAALGVMGGWGGLANAGTLGARPKRRSWTFDFMGNSRWFFTLSGTILLIGALAIGAKGLNFGIDFKSGTRIQTGLVRPASEAEVRSVLAAAHYPDAEIQKFHSKEVGSGYQISVKKLRPGGVDKVKEDLEAKFGLRNNTFSATSIGPTFGSTVANEAVIAIIASLLVISVYIAWRFAWKYAVPVLIALMHDLLITTGVYSLTGREVTAATVAALLTILGYSMYDTIIVFDRIRENVPRMPRAAFSQIVNRSMAEVLTRSLATSFCTLLPVLALLLFGGETLKDFAFALLVGIASGAYSSIFIASPVLTHWKERESSYRNRRARLIREFGRVPAYAGAAAAAAEGERVEAPAGRRTRRGRAVAPEQPGEQISAEEFQDLVRDLDIEETGPAAAGASAQGKRPPSQRGGAAAAAVASPETERASREVNGEAPAKDADAKPDAAPDADQAPSPAADATPEELVLKDASRPRERKRPRARRHGRKR
jgi:SecD/SecF fusion protein